MTEPSSKKKPRDFTEKFLTDDEVRLIARRVRKVIGPILGKLSADYKIEIENSLRFEAVAARLKHEREQRGMDLKAAAKALRVPQYRLRDIEESRMRNLRPSDLHAYIELLGLKEWFLRWSKANPKLALRLAPEPNSDVK